jgi:hypothetical protein
MKLSLKSNDQLIHAYLNPLFNIKKSVMVYFLVLLQSLFIYVNDTNKIVQESLRIAFDEESQFLFESDSLFRNNYGVDFSLIDFKLIDVANKNGCDLVKEDESIYIIDVQIVSLSTSRAKVKIFKDCYFKIDNECMNNLLCGATLGIEFVKEDENWEGEIYGTSIN